MVTDIVQIELINIIYFGIVLTDLMKINIDAISCIILTINDKIVVIMIW